MLSLLRERVEIVWYTAWKVEEKVWFRNSFRRRRAQCQTFSRPLVVVSVRCQALCTDNDTRGNWTYLHPRSAYSFRASIVRRIFFYRRTTRRRADDISAAWRPRMVTIKQRCRPLCIAQYDDETILCIIDYIIARMEMNFTAQVIEMWNLCHIWV